MKRRNLLALALASPVAFSVARAQTLSSGDYRQMQVGRDEPILEPDIPIIDAHHHLVDRPGLRYMIDDYLADTRAGRLRPMRRMRYSSARPRRSIACVCRLRRPGKLQAHRPRDEAPGSSRKRIAPRYRTHFVAPSLSRTHLQQRN